MNVVVNIIWGVLIIAYVAGIATWAWVVWLAWQFMKGKRSHEINYSYAEKSGNLDGDSVAGDYRMVSTHEAGSGPRTRG